jgi:arginyl-tRNA synthetase
VRKESLTQGETSKKKKENNKLKKTKSNFNEESLSNVDAKRKSSKNFLFYKNNPLVRYNETIYYGDMSKDFVIKLQIKSKKKFLDLNVATKVSVQLLDTDPDLDDMKRIVKKSEKNGLYSAIDIADAWLLKALNLK